MGVDQTREPGTTAREPRWGGKARLVLPGLLLVLGAANLFVVLQATTPPSYDPAYHFLLGLRAGRLLEEPGLPSPSRLLSVSGYYPPLFYWVMGVHFRLFGESLAVGRATGVVFLLLAVYGFYRIGRQLGGPRAGIASAVVAALTPGLVGYSRTMYLDVPLLAMLALCYWMLLASGGGVKRVAMAGAGVFAGLAVLTKWTAPLFLAVPAIAVVGAGLWGYDLATDRRFAPPRRRIAVNAALAAAAALLIGGPWYGRYARHVLDVMSWVLDVKAAQVGDPTWRELEGWIYYLVNLEGGALHASLGLFTVAAFLAALRCARARPGLAAQVAFWALGYAALTVLHQKSPRFAIPLLLFSIPLCGLLCCHLWKSPRGRLAVAALAAIGVVEFLDLTFAFRFLPVHVASSARHGEIVWWSKARAGSLLTAREEWPNRDIVQWIADGRTAAASDAVGVVLTNHWFLNAETLGLEAKLARRPMTFELLTASLPLAQRMNRVVNADFVVVKTGDVGPQYTLDPSSFALRDLESGKKSLIRHLFGEPRVFPLPDRSEAWVFARESSEPPWIETPCDFAPLIALKRLRVVDPVVLPGTSFALECEWRLHQPMRAGIAFFLHLDSSDDALRVSDMIWLLDSLPAPLDPASPQVVVHRFTIPGEADLGTEPLTVRIGLWDTEADILLEATTPQGPVLVQELPMPVWVGSAQTGERRSAELTE